jgi:hypothetical protein
MRRVVFAQLTVTHRSERDRPAQQVSAGRPAANVYLEPGSLNSSLPYLPSTRCDRRGSNDPVALYQARCLAVGPTRHPIGNVTSLAYQKG